MAAFVGQVIGLGLDDACGEPKIAMTVANDLAQQIPGQLLGIAVEECVWKRALRAGGVEHLHVIGWGAQDHSNLHAASANLTGLPDISASCEAFWTKE